MPATNELLQEGRYRINQQFAALDGAGAVYEAYDTVRETEVVVKEIVVRLNKVTTISQQETMKLAFANQAKLLTEIKHDSLLHVHDFFSEIGRQYLVMESVEGDDLAKLIEQNRSAFPVTDVAAWADQLLDALHYLHNFNPPIIHKNIKPRNIKLSPDGKVKLLAHGLADGTDTKISTNLVDDTKDSTVLNYSPLEQIWDGLDSASQKVITNSYDDRSERVLKEPADARSDLYSLGATLYQLLTAKMPIDPLERSIDILEGKSDPLKVPNKIDPRIPPEISDVVMRALEIKRENRFDSAVIMRQVLRTAVVRMQERDAEEMREQEEAAADLRFAERTRQEQVNMLVEQKSREIESEQKRQSEILEQKLREVEEQRLLAEQRAAEAERLLSERDAEREKFEEERRHVERQYVVSNAVPVRDPEDDLLGLNKSFANADRDASSSQIHISQPEPVQAFIAQERIPAEAEVRAFFDDSKADQAHEAVEHQDLNESVGIESELEIESETAAVREEQLVEPAEGEVAYIEPESIEEEEYVTAPVAPEISEPSFAMETAGPGFKMGVPLIAGALVLLIAAAVGGWMFLGSGANEPAPAASNPPLSTQLPAAPAVSDQAALPSPSPTDADPVVSETPVDPASTIQPGAQSAPVKAKKPAAEAAKTPAPKKAVTVDDLINDN